MKAEAKFNHCGEPTVVLEPESAEEISVLQTMYGKFKGLDGNHILVMGKLEVNGELHCATVTTNPVGHPTTFRYGPGETPV